MPSPGTGRFFYASQAVNCLATFISPYGTTRLRALIRSLADTRFSIPQPPGSRQAAAGPDHDRSLCDLSLPLRPLRPPREVFRIVL